MPKTRAYGFPREGAAQRAAATAAKTRALGRPLADALNPARAYSDEEFAFIKAAETYRSRYQKRFMEACDYLFVLKQMGYVRPEGPPP